MRRKVLAILLIIAASGFFGASLSYQVKFEIGAQSEEQRLDGISKQIEEYERELSRLKTQAGSLSNQIAQFDAQIRLTGLKIAETEEKIFLLGGRIDQIEASLESLTSAFVNRAVKTYKMSRLGEEFTFILASEDVGNAVKNYNYLKRIQEADRELLKRLESAQNAYISQKDEQEKLQKKLEEQRTVLGAQKSAKARLLEETRNDEKRYQQLLSQARAEFEAIQAIIAGRGIETQVGRVSEGERIASIIQGPSCNSSGSHLHFTVSQNRTTVNPFNYLKSGVEHNNVSGGDPFNPSGSWEWPVSPPIRFTQGYGETWAIRNTWVGNIYRFHNGIDINSANPEVKAVQSGTLFRGSYTGTAGCRLRYVRVAHETSDISTFYLHINY
jgi:peptidoglycan hydrolase CwlO-like protein